MDEPNSYTSGTTLLFIIPTVISAYYNQWDMYCFNLNMLVMSSVYSISNHVVFFYLDQASTYLMLATLCRVSYKEKVPYIGVITSVYCFFVYYIGYITNSFVWDTNGEGFAYHISMYSSMILSSMILSHIAWQRESKLLL
jgi:hypothetical protein